AVPRDLETIIHKAMAKRPEDRYATAQELADDLRRFRNYEPIRARRIGIVGRVARWCRRNPRLAAMTAVALFVPLLLTVVYVASLRAQFAATLEAQHQSETLREELQDQLCHSRLSEAKARLASDLPGRYWEVLKLLGEAEE